MGGIARKRSLRTAFLALVVAAFPVAAQNTSDPVEEDDGGGFLERQIENRLSGPGFDVDVRGFEGALSSRATVSAIIISDDEGPWLTVRDAVLDWNRSALLRGRLEVEELSAASISLPRLPQGDNSTNVPSPEAQPFSLPDLPVSINIDRLAIDRVELGEPVIGQAVALSLEGSAELAGGAGQVDLHAERVDGEQGVFDIAGSYDNETSDLSVNLNVDEGAGGIVASLAGLPGEPPLSASIEGSGPLSDFTATIALATAGEPRLDGTVTLMEDDQGASRFSVDLGGDLSELFTPQYRSFLGTDVQLTAEGSRSADGAIDLQALNLDSQSLELQGQVRIGADGVPDLIDVTGQVASDRGPVLLPAGSDIRVGRVGLDVQFDASAGESWTGDIVLENFEQPGVAIERIALDGSGIIAGSGDTLEVTADLDFAADGLDLETEGLTEALGDSITGRAQIGYDAGSPIVLSELTVDGAGFDLSGNGQVDPDGENLPVAFDARLDASDLAVFAALAGRPLAGGLSADLDLNATLLDGGFDVTLDGQAQDLRVGVETLDPLLTGQTDLTLDATRDANGLRVDTMTLQNEAVDLDGTADLTSETGTARANVRVDDLGRISPDLSGPATLAFTAENPGDAWTINLTADGAEANVDGNAVISELDAESPLADFDLSVAAGNLSNFSVFAGRELGGSLDITTDGRARLDASNVTAQIDGTMQDIALDQPESDRLLAGTTTLSASMEKDGERITVPDLSIENPQITASGNARIAPQDSLVDADIVIAELSEVVPSMSGEAEVSLDASENAEGWTVAFDATGADASVSADGTVTELDGAGSPLADGTVSINVPDLAAFSELARRELGGVIDLTADGSARFDFSQAEGRIDGTLRDLAVGQPDLNRLLSGVTELAAQAQKSGDVITVPDITLSNPQINIDGEGEYGTPDGAIRARIALPDLGDVVPELSGAAALDLLAERMEEAWQVTLDGDGAGIVLDASASVTGLETADAPAVDGQMSLQAADLSRFARVSGQSLAGSLDLSASGNAVTDGSNFDVEAQGSADGLRTGIAEVDQLLGGTTTFDAAASREGPEAPIEVERFSLDSAGLDATANGRLLGGQSDLTFDARLSDLGIFVDGLNGPVTATGRAGQAEQNFTIDTDVTGPAGITATISGQVAESFETANIDVTGSAPLRLANPFLDPRALSGQAQFDLGLDGPLALSSLSGTVTVADGRLVDPSLPAVLDNIDATARIQNSNVQLSVTAQKQEGGQIQVSGPISLQSGYDANLAIVLDNVIFEDPRLYRTELDGTLSVAGALTGGARIAGTITLDETDVRIPSTGLGATGPIPDGLVHVGESQAVRQTLRRAGLLDDPQEGGAGGGASVAFPLDITILAPNRIFIRGRGLDAELGGQLTLQGTTANVIPSGQFDLIRGRLDLLGQRIVLTEGEFALQGDFTPVIRLVARTEQGDVVILIIVEGPALSPEIDFRSEPELPQDEVLARLLFGRSIDEISPIQAAQLASAVATLAGRGGDGIISNIRQNIGLDDLDVTTDEEGNVGVRAGKYISENVYTDVTVGSDGEAEINLNLDVTDSVTVRGGASNDGETSLGVFFERDY
ncbi:autotransporter secretion inner membrane protein TamB [Palleronia aestuarii]|uniref:Autotransporter secretion inner membrane protein TamB n=1 Tax=Palleronia aestuarii TaxID=568105 RepID=A0A2W7NHG6_9RHOB|nr:translocation/assembly module TamB domain-containing protein [Palleronia aestuarii]PZX18903.1 autotransporter secretion inner membrane protein TamB [Palleronia aestuarii]